MNMMSSLSTNFFHEFRHNIHHTNNILFSLCIINIITKYWQETASHNKSVYPFILLSWLSLFASNMPHFLNRLLVTRQITSIHFLKFRKNKQAIKANLFHFFHHHYNDVIMSAMASQISSLTIVYATVYSGANQRKHQSSVPLAFVRGIHQRSVNAPHKGPVTRKMYPCDDDA